MRENMDMKRGLTELMTPLAISGVENEFAIPTESKSAQLFAYTHKQVCVCQFGGALGGRVTQYEKLWHHEHVPPKIYIFNKHDHSLQLWSKPHMDRLG